MLALRRATPELATTMGRKHKGKIGFNQPFADLPHEAPAQPPKQPPSPPSPPVTATHNDEPDDEGLFLRAVGNVRRLPDKAPPVPRAPVEHRPADNDEAAALAELHALVDGQAPFRIFDAEEDHSGLAPGVNFQLLEELRRGHFAVRRHLDLHGLSRDAAREAVRGFIIAARRDDKRCVLIVTGRGHKSPGGISVLREALPCWLSQAPLRAHVLAFCAAKPVDGGPGAFYVLVRRAGVRPFGNNI